MSLTRRLAAGLSAAGVTVLAALALAGSPAAATGDEAAARAKRPAVMTTPCSEAPRGDKCPYAYGSEAPTGGPTRGNGGYGSESPTPSPSTSPSTPVSTPSPTPSTPTASVNTVPPGGEKPATSPSPSPTKGGGVSAGGTLPLTGAPMGLTIALGGALIVAGAGAIYYGRRRRSA